MDEATQVEFIATVCKGFADSINDSCGTRFGGKEGYEVLSLVFGEVFGPAQLRAATAEQSRDLAMAVWELLQTRVPAQTISAALERALQAAG
jgi:hypothetical protein